MGKCSSKIHIFNFFNHNLKVLTTKIIFLYNVTFEFDKNKLFSVSVWPDEDIFECFLAKFSSIRYRYMHLCWSFILAWQHSEFLSKKVKIVAIHVQSFQNVWPHFCFRISNFAAGRRRTWGAIRRTGCTSLTRRRTSWSPAAGWAKIASGSKTIKLFCSTS